MKNITLALGLTSIVALVALHGCAAGESPAEETSAPEPVGAGPQALAAPSDFSIEGITGAGPGCRPGSIASAITPDKQTFTVYYSEMILQHDPGSGALAGTLQTINCTVGVTLHVPQGWQLALGTVNTRGYVNIPARASAEELSSYNFAGVRLQVSGHSTLGGPRNENYVFTDNFGIVSYSPCGQDATLNINTRIVLNTKANPGENALMTVDQTDGKFKKIFHLMWQTCH